jgi:MHS family alpha-ketoglutarate permease-like MFS transporter
MREDKDAGSIAALFRDHKAAFITVLGYTAGGSLIFYTFTTYMQKYLVNTAGMHAKTASYHDRRTVPVHVHAAAVRHARRQDRPA